jgi:tetratricopeptide (TPR) repeat protein
MQILEHEQQRHKARLDEHVEQLADHAVRGQLWEKAETYCRQAASKALQHSAHGEAIVFLNQFLESQDHLPHTDERAQQIVDVHLDLRTSHGATGDVNKMLQHLQNARELAEAIGDEIRKAWITVFSCSVVEFRGDQAKWQPWLNHAEKVASEADDSHLLRMVRFGLCGAYLHWGEFAKALDTLALHQADFDGPLRHERFGMTGTWSLQFLANGAMAYLQLGQFDAAMRSAQECRLIAEEVDRPFDLGLADWILGSVLLYQGNFDEAIPVLERGVTVCRESGTNILLPMLSAPLAYAHVLDGDRVKAEQLALDAWKQLRGTNVFWLYIWLYAPLASTFREIGALQEAQDVAAFAADLAKEMGLQGMYTENQRVLGSIAAATKGGNSDDAETLFRTAMASSEALQMPAESAHCKFEIARLQARTEHEEAALANLAEAIKMYRELSMHFWADKAENLQAKTNAEAAK